MPKSVFISKIGIGITPLHTAIERGKFTEACKLVESGVDVNRKNLRGNTPLHLLLQNEARVSTDDRLKVVRLLLEHGATVDQQNGCGHTALHLAAGNGHTAAIESLLQHGATVDQRNRYSETALDRAAWKGQPIAIELLLKNGAKVDQQNKFGTTALHLAAEDGQAAVIELLLKNGATVDWQNEYGYTALHFAVCHGHIEVVKLLLRHGAMVHWQNRYGDTALHFAAGRRHTAAIELLLENGAMVDRQNEDGETALHRAMDFQNPHAAEAGCFDAVLCLLKGGADVGIVSDANGESVLQTAIRCSGRSKLSELLIHEHLSRQTDREAIKELMTKACSNDDDGLTRSWCEGILRKHECSSAATMEFRDEGSEDAPVVLRLAVRDLLDRSKPNGFMSKLVSRGVGAKPARNTLEEIIASDRIKDGCSYCLSGLKERLAEQEERVLETDGALKRFNAYAYPPREDEPLTRIPEEVAEQILSRLPVGRLRLFTEALSPSNTSRVYDATELCNPDMGMPGLRP